MKKEDILLKAQKIKAAAIKEVTEVPLAEKPIITAPVILPTIVPTMAVALPVIAEKETFMTEKLTFKAKYLGLTIGEFIIINNGITVFNGTDAYYFEMLSKTLPFFSVLFGAKDRYVSYMDAKNFVVLRHEEYIKGGTVLESSIDFDYPNHTAVYKNHVNGQVKNVPIPNKILDVLCGGFYLRMLPLGLGDTSEFDLYSDDKVYNFVGLLFSKEKFILPDSTSHPVYLFKPYVFENGKQIKKISAEVFITTSAEKKPLHATLKSPLGNVSVVLSESINLPTKGSL